LGLTIWVFSSFLNYLAELFIRTSTFIRIKTPTCMTTTQLKSVKSKFFCPCLIHYLFTSFFIDTLNCFVLLFWYGSNTWSLSLLPINRTQVFSLRTLLCISEFWNFVLSCVNITICFLLTNTTAPMFLFDAILSILWHGKIKKDIFKHFCWLMLNNLDLIRKYFTNQKKCFCVVHKNLKIK